MMLAFLTMLFFAGLMGICVGVLILQIPLFERYIANKIMKKREAKHERSKLGRAIAIFVAVCFLMATTLYLLNVFIAVQASASFRLRMMALAPVLSDHEKDVLTGEWAKVKSRYDYDELMRQMDYAAFSHHTQIPDPLI